MSLRRKLDVYDDGDSPESSQMAMKRKRVVESEDENSNQNGINDDQDNIDSESDNLPTASLVFDHPVAPLPVGEDGYVEGSIVKIVLRNFVTYDFCEFSPGPQLNMIIGPNGTGKSTIVCAVALGLGGTPQLLGRAKNVCDFVKTGEENASIQIELKKVEGRNVVIQRSINKGNNSSTWKLNGRSATYREIMNIITPLNIQVDNLCQFLPQDKVAEFAQLTPPQLLARTQVAVGDKDLTKWHEELCVKRQKQKDLQKTHESNSNHHKNLQARNQLLEKDIQRIKEKEKLSKEISLLKATLPLARYTDAKKNLELAKEEEKEARDTKAILDREYQPVKQVLENSKLESQCKGRDKKKASDEANATSSNLGKITDAIAKSTQNQRTLKSTIEQIKKREQRREDEIRRIEDLINKLEDEVREEPPLVEDEMAEEIDALTREINDEAIKSRNEAETAKDFMNQKREKDHYIQLKKRELNEMQDIKRIRLDNLRRHQEDTYKALQWYKENKTLFQGKIYGPIQLAINLKDKRYADQVESILGGVQSSHLKTFVCEYADDYKKFMAEMVDKRGLRLTASWPGNIDVAATIKTPCSDDELKKSYGLDHFLINLLDAPALVLAYLCQQLYINTYPVTLQRVNVERIVDHSNYVRFAVAGNIYRVKKYTYGRGGSQTTVKTTSTARILTDTVDKELYERKLSQVRQLEMEASTIEAEIEDLNKKKQEFAQKLNELKHKREEKKSLRADMMRAHNTWLGCKRKLVRYQDELEAKKSEPAEMEQEIEKCKADITQEAKHRAKLVTQYKKTLELYVKKVMLRNEASLQELYAHVISESMITFARSQEIKLKNADLVVKQAQARTHNCKVTVRQHLDSANKVGQDLPTELQDEFKQICQDWQANNGLDKTYQDIEDAIHGLQAKSDSLTMTNPLAMATYEKLMTEMKNLDERMASNTEELETINKDIADIHNSWEPRLTRLIARISEKFSEAFQRIGCAGEVGIGRDEDYGKWGINIQVKFRDTEKLQLLTGQRQSGGERAVSTILYLMSLQNLARAPFRVVDEINQGMDPRNERMIHEQIVKSASLAGTSQYFLITPKLLPDLYYNEHMRVLCIYNGEWQPEKLKPAEHYLQEAKKTMVAS